MQRRVKLERLVVPGILLGWLSGGPPTAVIAQARADFEKPPTLTVHDLAPSEQLRGPGYRIDDTVPTDGFLATFTVRSDYGVFKARGPGMLEMRLREVAGLRQLDAISKSDAFVQGLKASATELGGEAKQIVTHPVETAKGIPAGVGRFFLRVGRGAKTGVQKLSATKAEQDAPAPPPPGPGSRLPGATAPGSKADVSIPAEAARSAGRVTRDAFGYDDRRRELAKEVGVDPYTSNPVLAKKLDDIAWAAFAGGLGVTALKAAVPASMVISTSTMLTGWVYDMPPGDLKVRNEKSLRAMGVSQEEVDHLLRHRWYTLTLQSALVQGLERLEGASGRPGVMPLALTVASEEQARFVVGAVQMLARHHEQVTPLASLQVQGTVVAQTRDGAIIVPGPVDYLSWTKTIDRFSRRPDLTQPKRVLLLSGEASPRARRELERRAWTVETRVPIVASAPTSR